MRQAILFLLVTLLVQQASAQRKHWIKEGKAVKKDEATHYFTLSKTPAKTYLYKEYDRLTDSLFQEINYPTKERLSKEGEFKRYFENGNVEHQGVYLNNLKSGLWIFYKKTGELEKTVSYREGLKQGQFTEYKKGLLSSVFRYKADSLHSLIQLNNEKNKIVFIEDTADMAVYTFVDEEAIFSENSNELNRLLIDSKTNNNTKSVYITFNVDKNGKVSEVIVDKLTKSTDLEQECKEALIKVALLPNWKEPAMKRGSVVKSRRKCKVAVN